MFFMGGNASKTLNTQSDASITVTLDSYLTTMGISSSTIHFLKTSWETDPYALGSYSFYKVGTTDDDFKQLLKSIDGKVWLVGEHTHPNQSSYVHGAYQTGYWAGEAASSSSQCLKCLVALWTMLVIALML